MDLTELLPGKEAIVSGLAYPQGPNRASSTHSQGNGRASPFQRLQDLGFLPGQVVQVLQRSLGQRGPLAVLLGQTLWALRPSEAQCVQVYKP